MRSPLELDFTKQDVAGLNILQTGGGRISRQGILLLTLAPNEGYEYNNAQLDDYNHLRRSQFCWQAPLTLRVRARFSHEGLGTGAPEAGRRLNGTAGFGFWNDPFMMTGWRMPSLPRALWFFYSGADSNMQLAHGVPGNGFKAAVIDAWTPGFFSLWPVAPIMLPLMHSQTMQDKFWPLAQRSMKVEEKSISHSMTEWRNYELTWKPNEVTFSIDGQVHFRTQSAPKGPLGLVIWIDNQYMIATPTGRLRHGVVSTEFRQTLELKKLEILPLVN